MPKSRVTEQIQQTLQALQSYTEYSEALATHLELLKALQRIDETPGKGLLRPLDTRMINDILRKALSDRQPISHQLPTHEFDASLLLAAFEEIAERLGGKHERGKELTEFIKRLEADKSYVKELVNAALARDASGLKGTSQASREDEGFLLGIIRLSLRPLFEDIGRNVEGKLEEAWWESFCPICGSKPIVVRKRQRKSYAACVYCGIEYLVDPFTCPNCGNSDPSTQGFVSFQQLPEYEIDYCVKCNHYVKVVYTERIEKSLPIGLEDLLTGMLDRFATGKDLELSRT